MLVRLPSVLCDVAHVPGAPLLHLCPAAVDALHARLESEARAWRSLQLGASKADGLLEVRGSALCGRSERTLPGLSAQQVAVVLMCLSSARCRSQLAAARSWARASASSAL